MKVSFYIIVSKEYTTIYSYHPATRYGGSRYSMSYVTMGNFEAFLMTDKDYCKFGTEEAARNALVNLVDEKPGYHIDKFVILPVTIETNLTLSTEIEVKDPKEVEHELLRQQKKVANKEIKIIRDEYENGEGPGLTIRTTLEGNSGWSEERNPEVVNRVNKYCEQFGENKDIISEHMLNRLFANENC